MSDRHAILSRAREYPYALPDRSYLWIGEREDPTRTEPFDAAMTEGRTPVLAVGSNQSPRQLARKYGVGGGHAIPVQRATVRDFDSVYAAHISSYGAAPAMLQRAPGVDATLFVNWLDEEQLDHMHGTEGNYRFAEIENIQIEFDEGTSRDSIYLYVARLGHFVHEGGPVSLAAVPARGRTNGARTTADMLRLVHDRLDYAGDHDRFVLNLVQDAAFRRRCIDVISEDSAPFGHPYRIIEP